MVNEAWVGGLKTSVIFQAIENLNDDEKTQLDLTSLFLSYTKDKILATVYQ